MILFLPIKKILTFFLIYYVNVLDKREERYIVENILVFDSKTDRISNLIEKLKKFKKINLIIMQKQKEIQDYIINNEKVIFLFEFSEISFQTFREIKLKVDEIIPIALCTEEEYIEIAEKYNIFYLDVEFVNNQFIEYVLKIVFNIKINDKDYYHDLLNSQELDINCVANNYLIKKEKEAIYNIVDNFGLNYINEGQLNKILCTFLENDKPAEKIDVDNEIANIVYEFSEDGDSVDIVNIADELVKQNEKLKIIKFKDNEKITFSKIVKEILIRVYDRYKKQYDLKYKNKK